VNLRDSTAVEIPPTGLPAGKCCSRLEGVREAGFPVVVVVVVAAAWEDCDNDVKSDSTVVSVAASC